MRHFRLQRERGQGTKCPACQKQRAASVSCLRSSVLGGLPRPGPGPGPARGGRGTPLHAAGDLCTHARRGWAGSRVPPRETLPLPRERMKGRPSRRVHGARPALLCGARAAAVAVGHFCRGSRLAAFGWPGSGSSTGCTPAPGVPLSGDRCSAGPSLSVPQTA